MKNNQRISLTKQLLQDALLRLMKNRRIQEITVAELCREAGINRSTFYRHYDIPSAVLEDILYSHLQAIGKEVTFLPDDREKNILNIHRYIYAHREVFFLLFRDNDSRIDAMVRNKLLEELARGRLTKMPRQNLPPMYVTFLIAGLRAVCCEWLAAEKPWSPKKMSQFTFALMNREDLPAAPGEDGLLKQQTGG